MKPFADRLSSARDADRQCTEDHYRLLLEHVTDIVAVFSPDRTVRYISPAVTRVLGFTPEEVLANSHILTLHPEDESQYARFINESIKDPGATGTTDVRVRHRNGSWRLLETTVTNLTHRPEIDGLLSITRDVTDRRRFEEQIHQAQRMESIGSLAGGVAHDFNNVLTAIMGYGELMLGDPNIEPCLRADIQEVLRAGQRASALTRQLLAFSRKESTEPRLVNLNTLVEDLLKMLRRLITENIHLRMDLHPDLWEIYADPAHVEQVLMNLAVNARDAMPDGGSLTIVTTNDVVDEIRARRENLPVGRCVCLTVRDTGGGMNEQVRTHAFEPFFTTKEAGKGTGLGLSTCYGVVKQAGGQIVVDSEPGAGTTISIYWPRRDDDAERLPGPAIDAPAVARGMCILVVDDDPHVRALIARTLSRAGYRTLQADDGETALQIVRGGEPIDLLLTDIVLSGINGLTLATAVQEHDPSIRKLFMSGYHDSVAQAVRDARGADALIPKPFTPSVLAQRVRRALDG